jgi:hypothetical protein
MAEVIADSEDGPAVAYYLGKNPEAAAAIAQLPPSAAARELGKLEARLAFEREKARTPATPARSAVSQAPPPPPKIEASEPDVAPVSAGDPDSDKLSVNEWMRRREKEVRRSFKR